MFRNKSTNVILIITTLLFSVKWVLSFYFFKESLSVKIIFESVMDDQSIFSVSIIFILKYIRHLIATIRS